MSLYLSVGGGHQRERKEVKRKEKQKEFSRLAQTPSTVTMSAVFDVKQRCVLLLLLVLSRLAEKGSIPPPPPPPFIETQSATAAGQAVQLTSAINTSET